MKIAPLATALIFSTLFWVGNAASVSPEVVVEGRLNRETLEGGFWTLRADDGALYDIHGEVIFQDGDRLRIKGITPQGISCIHMKGRIFIPTSMERLESARVEAPILSPSTSPSASDGTWLIKGRKLIHETSTKTETLVKGNPNLMGMTQARDRAWALINGTFTYYGAGGQILWQEGQVQHFRMSPDGKVCILARHIDPKGGKRRRDYAAVFLDGKPIFEFYKAPLAITFRKEDVPIFLTSNGRFGWIQDNVQTIFFDTWTKNQKSFKGEGFAEIDETGTYKIWGLKFGGNYTMLRREGKLE